MSMLESLICSPELARQKLTEEELQRCIPLLNHKWVIEGGVLSADFLFSSYLEAFDFVRRTALLAEAEGHHPSLIWNYTSVCIQLTTNQIKALTKNDFILARKVELAHHGIGENHDR
jgi:4a-hydroxytetrahydrobiopterin dehydratase